MQPKKNLIVFKMFFLDLAIVFNATCAAFNLYVYIQEEQAISLVFAGIHLFFLNRVLRVKYKDVDK